MTVVDTWSRLCLVMRVCRSATAMVAIEALQEARHSFGLPRRSGCQFTSKELDLWAYTHGIALDFCRPGKLTDNVYVESFNTSARLECLGQWIWTMPSRRWNIGATSAMK